MKNVENRILTTHVGSLVRPKDFQELGWRLGIGWEQYLIERLGGFGPREPFERRAGSEAVSIASRQLWP
ncbi:MAG: hypothetical protein ACREFD_17065 [Stellaceae bacterium]